MNSGLGNIRRPGIDLLMVKSIVIFDCAFFWVGLMIIEDKTKGNFENKAYLLELEKRLVSLESSVQNIAAGMQRGSLAPEQEQRVAAVEDRLENTEDLQMVVSLDLIKMREILENPRSAGEFAPNMAADEPSRKKIGEIENIVNALDRKVNAIESSKLSGKSVAGTGEEIKRLKENLESFEKETEESVKIIVSSIKKLAERTNR